MQAEPNAMRRHRHVFDQSNPAAERGTRRVALLTAAMMAVEIAGGVTFNSMALLADGLHMSTHAAALGLSLVAYALARRLASSARFAFGTFKIEVLGAYTSAVLLLVVALFMLYESVVRVLTPVAIHYDEAIAVAVVGLVVNVVCASWLQDDGHHSHDHGHKHDLNLRSAYLHVVADAATSVLAIVALSGGKFFGAAWLDPVMGIVGAGLVASWAYGLLRDTSRVLLDAEMEAPVVDEVREVIRNAPVRAEISDLHVWRVGKGKYACVVALSTAHELAPDTVRRWLGVHEELVHVSVEINRLP